jgi:glutamine phosphoribosylpyrophosphate amidotransferase
MGGLFGVVSKSDCVSDLYYGTDYHSHLGTRRGIGYANQRRLPYRRPFVKYTPTWPRSFMPQDQKMRDLVARMKLIPVRQLIDGQRILFCEDSIVRGTQLRDNVQVLFEYGAKEVHMRPAYPMTGCAHTAGTERISRTNRNKVKDLHPRRKP